MPATAAEKNTRASSTRNPTNHGGLEILSAPAQLFGISNHLHLLGRLSKQALHGGGSVVVRQELDEVLVVVFVSKVEGGVAAAGPVVDVGATS